MAIDQDDNIIDIEMMIRDIGVRKNQTVISFLDCCRNEALAKGGEEAKANIGSFYGRSITVYTVQPGIKEYSSISEELSPGT
jgi:hypothetical protein